MKIGETVDNYLILDEIGEGGMGLVLKVQDSATNEVYALKYCKETDEKSISRFRREVKIATETKHKNIVEVVAVNLDNNPPYFVMPLAKGSVHDIIKNITGDFDKVLEIFEQMCKGVTVLHNTGKYHRDIKPRNALILQNGTVAITDFGLARLINRESSTHTSSNTFLGTVGYHAPEQIAAKNADARTDVFQLGKSFYEMYTSEYPFLINPKKLPAGLVYIIQKATSAEPNDRYQTVGELLQAINSFKKSLNPKENPIDALENKLLEMSKLLKSGYYNEEVCIAFIDLLGNNVDEPNIFIEYFDKIPNEILKIFANQLKDRFKPIFDVYTKNFELYFDSNTIDFRYAETVASKMAIIYNHTKDLEFRAIAIRNALRAAVWCHRFAAMDTFNHLIQQVKDNEEAGLITQILSEEIELYQSLADQVSDNDLHPVLREFKNDVLKKKEEEEKKANDEKDNWMDDLFK
ncbi:serine/threonine-protein kinase [Cellulophaga lytica]|uniref:serine/threonine-protein kinase n=1 Tax=Cellulophaga lytica TaxID=979 RepID=UPI000B5C326E|nr:serine/threonine-protein kinase [Cellulophaga lytica]SNQ43668.1 putative Serine/threonine protein kinase [Cellulophaga lytica]